MAVWVNDGLVDEDEAQLSIYDHGYTVGDGVFETTKVIDGVPFALTRHLARLTRSARGIGLAEPDLDRVRKAVSAVVAGGPAQRARLRITYTGGRAPLGSDRGPDNERAAPSLVVAVAEMHPWPLSSSLCVVPWTRNENSAVAGLKTTSYAENVVALAFARQRGADEAVFANTAGRLCEGTGSNVFLVIGGRTLTPPLTSGCLAGVTRALVLEWTDAEEADLDMSSIEAADEVFITSSTRDVLAVHAVDARRFLAPGPLTTKAIDTFAHRCAQDVDP